MPIVLTLTVPEDPETLIEPLDNSESARYYVTIEWDSNDDAEINGTGDLFLDFGTNEFNLDIESTEIQKRNLIVL